MSRPDSTTIQSDGWELRIAILETERHPDRWTVITENGLTFANPLGSNPSFREPVAAAVRVNNPDDKRHIASSVAIGEVNSNAFDETHSLYLLHDGMYYAMDEAGDVGVGGSFVEAVNNTDLIQGLK